MNTYKKILVAVDIYGGAEEVLGRASELMKDGGVECIFLNVSYVLTQAYGVSGVTAPADYYLNIDDIRADHLARLKEMVSEKGMDENAVLVESGRPSDQILEVADREEVDLILIGSHGRYGLRILLGSTANAVLHRARCDVLAVKINEKV